MAFFFFQVTARHIPKRCQDIHTWQREGGLADKPFPEACVIANSNPAACSRIREHALKKNFHL